MSATVAGFYATDNQTSAGTEGSHSQFVLRWVGLQQAFFDGYEITANAEEIHVQFTADSTDWPNQIQWGDQHRSWITVRQSTGKTYNFYYYWTGAYPNQYPNYGHIDNLTVEFSPICIEQELCPETFLKHLERLGHDDAYLRVNYKMQKKMMKATGHLPPWDPRKIEELEEMRVQLRDRFGELRAEKQIELKEHLMERWGIEEIPPITGELLDQIAAKSRTFLEECLSPGELEFFDEHGHLKIRSRKHSNIYYIVKVKDSAKVERYDNNELYGKICIHSAWAGLPALDTVAMKVLNIKYNEEGFLKIGNMTRVRPKGGYRS